MLYTLNLHDVTCQVYFNLNILWDFTLEYGWVASVCWLNLTNEYN